MNLSHIVKNTLHVETINQLDYSYTRLKLLNLAQKKLRFAMVDEIQDYSLDQIIFLITAFPKANWTLVGDQFQSILATENPLTFDNLKDIFEQHKIKVTQRNLYTSYRSSGAITKAFISHGAPGLIEKITTVQTGGVLPQWIESHNTDALIDNLRKQIEEFNTDELSAIITDDSTLASLINDKIKQVVLGTNAEKLPANGVVALPLTLAKGLEFDNVIIANLNTAYYQDSQFGENRIYTAFSRASKQLIINQVLN